MKIDITREPPADIFRNRSRYLRIFVMLLALTLIGVLVVVYILVSGMSYYDSLETVALAFYVVAGVAIFYVGEKLQASGRLNPQQEKELADLRRRHPEINDYCALVAKAGRKPIKAEYDACEAWAEEAEQRDQQV